MKKRVSGSEEARLYEAAKWLIMSFENPAMSRLRGSRAKYVLRAAAAFLKLPDPMKAPRSEEYAGEEIDTLRAKLKGYKADCVGMTARIAELQQEIETLKRNIDAGERHIYQLEKERIQLGRYLADAHRANDKLSLELAQAKEDVRKAKNVHEIAIRNDKAEIMERLDALRQRVEALEGWR